MNATECACRQAERDNLVSELTAALTDLVGWFPTGPGVWHTDAPIKAVERARVLLTRAKEQQQ